MTGVALPSGLPLASPQGELAAQYGSVQLRVQEPYFGRSRSGLLHSIHPKWPRGVHWSHRARCSVLLRQSRVDRSAFRGRKVDGGVLPVRASAGEPKLRPIVLRTREGSMMGPRLMGNSCQLANRSLFQNGHDDKGDSYSRVAGNPKGISRPPPSFP